MPLDHTHYYHDTDDITESLWPAYHIFHWSYPTKGCLIDGYKVNTAQVVHYIDAVAA